MFRYGSYSYELLLSKEHFDLYLYIGYFLHLKQLRLLFLFKLINLVQNGNTHQR